MRQRATAQMTASGKAVGCIGESGLRELSFSQDAKHIGKSGGPRRTY
jgi:hypothetical protein